MTTEQMAKMIRRSVTLPRTADEGKPTKPAAWRDLTDQVKAVFYHFAIRARGTSYRFDLNLSPEIAAAAKGKGEQACEYIRRKVALALKKALGTSPEFVLALEEDGSRRLHVHGTMSIPEDHREAARDALKKAGGEWDGEGGQFQVNMRPQQIDPDLRGGTYVVKNMVWSTPKMRTFLEKIGDTKRMPVFKGRALTVTRGVRRDAEEIYGAARKLVIDHRKGTGRQN